MRVCQFRHSGLRNRVRPTAALNFPKSGSAMARGSGELGAGSRELRRNSSPCSLLPAPRSKLPAPRSPLIPLHPRFDFDGPGVDAACQSDWAYVRKTLLPLAKPTALRLRTCRDGSKQPAGESSSPTLAILPRRSSISLIGQQFRTEGSMMHQVPYSSCSRQSI